jgi:hypothetical protein
MHIKHAFVWTMKNANNVEITLTVIAGALLLLFLVVMPIDIVDFYEDQDTYVMVHQLDTNEKNWEWQYLSGWVYLGILIIVGLTIMMLRLIRKNNEIIRKLNWTFLILFFGSIIVGFYKWMQTGFDL